MKRFIALTSVLVILFTSCALAQDTLKLKNGDEIHGEIKSLNKSVVVIETPYSDADFTIEWEDVVGISGVRQFTIFFSSREKLYASFHFSNVPGTAVLITDTGQRREVNLNEIVIIQPIQDSFADRFNASISAGLSVTKASNAKQFSTRATMSYRTKVWNLGANYNDTRSEQDEVDPIRRTDGSISFKYLFYKNWFGALQGDFLSNTEQQISLRSTQTMAIGNMIVRNNKLYLTGSFGMTFNREDYSNEEEIFTTREGFLGTEFNAFNMGDLSLLTKLSYYPSFTEKHRHRVNFSFDVKYEFPLEFFIKLGYTLNFDSQPPNDGAPKDYVFQTTLGWEF